MIVWRQYSNFMGNKIKTCPFRELTFEHFVAYYFKRIGMSRTFGFCIK